MITPEFNLFGSICSPTSDPAPKGGEIYSEILG